MLWNASAIKDYAITADHERLGTISDFLFDDLSWRVRWLVIDTGTWLSGRKILLPPSVLGPLDLAQHRFPVQLTLEQVKNSPEIDSDLPVSRQVETSIFGHYGWVPYWGAAVFMPGYGYLGDAMTEQHSLEPEQGTEALSETVRPEGDPHLRSIDAVTGYHIHAKDGEIGHVEDFLVDESDWRIHYLVVDTKNWWPGKNVLISPRSVREIDFESRLVSLSVDRQKVKDSPLYDAATTIDGAYEKRYHDYFYGDVGESDRP